MNFNITRRQFLQYCTASAAALGLSQTDLLKLEKALAAPQLDPEHKYSPSVIWLSGQACSGCPVSLLNRMVMTGGNYYDADLLNALALTGSTLTEPTTIDVATNDPANHDSAFVNPLAVVNDAADLLVGDAVRKLVPSLNRSLLWADDAADAADGTLLPTDTLLDAYVGAFPRGYITLEWNATVMAAAGDIPAAHLKNIVNGGGLLGGFVLIVDGAIPDGTVRGVPGMDRYCYVFDNDDGSSGKIIDSIDHGQSVTAAEALAWMASAAGCLGIIAQGTCASFGGIPAAKGNKTGAMSVTDFLASKDIEKAVINVPGCPPHPDWTVYPVAYILSHSTYSVANGLSLALPTLDEDNRPLAVYSGSRGNDSDPFCLDCPNKDLQGDDAAETLGDAGCLGGLGCKGPYTVGDCPIRGKNTSDKGESMNWCVGASGQNSVPGSPTVSHIGDARHPCQGCIMKDFPDWTSLTVSGDRTSKRVKGFYNE